MKKNLERLTKIIEIFSFISLFIMLGVVSIQVIFRYTWFLRVPRWTEEVSRYSMIYTVAIASGLGIRRKAYLGMDSLYMIFPYRLKKIADIIFNILAGILFYILVVYGYEVMLSAMAQKSPSLRIPMYFIYISLPLTGLNVLIYLIEDTIKAIKGFIINDPDAFEDKTIEVKLS
ncbi:MAG: TRAP transporter small permease [Halanaerobiales bacterium]